MIYFAAKGEELLGFPIVAADLTEAKSRLTARQEKVLDELKDGFKDDGRVIEIDERINACEQIISTYEESEDDDITEEATETYGQAKEFLVGLKDSKEGIAQEYDKKIAGWTFDIEEIEFFSAVKV